MALQRAALPLALLLVLTLPLACKKESSPAPPAGPGPAVPTSSFTPTGSATLSATPSPTRTATPSPTNQPSHTSTSTASATASSTASATRTFTGSPTATHTPSLTASPTHTGTAAWTWTFTASPTATACSYYAFGSTDPGSATYAPGSAGYAIASDFYISSPMTVTGIRFYLWDDGGPTRVAIYIGPGEPANLVVESGTSNAVAGWNQFPLPPTVLPATDYWLTVHYSTGTQGIGQSPGNPGDLTAHLVMSPFTAFPAYTSTWAVNNGWRNSIYAVSCDNVATPVPTWSATLTRTSTSSPVPSATPTLSRTATPTATPTATTTPTATATPLVNCATFGKITVGAGNFASGALANVAATRFTLAVDADVTSLTVNLRSASGNGVARIYRDSAGTISTLLAASSSQALANGWNNFPLATTALDAGDYWLAVYLPTTGVQAAYDTGGSSIAWLNGSAPSGGTTVSASLSVYASYCPRPTPTPTVTLTPTPTPTPCHPRLLGWGSYGVPFSVSGENDLAVDSAGNAYLALTNGANKVLKLDPSGNVLAQWAPNGTNPGQINNPYGIARDAAGNLYVADIATDSITKFNASGAYVTRWGGYGAGNGQLSSPHGLAADASGNIYVADMGNHRVQKFTNAGAYVTQWGILGINNGQFNSPIDVDVDAAGNVYVLDLGNDRVQKFDPTGAYLGQFGSSGTNPGQFESAMRISVDSLGNVYVADTYSPYYLSKFNASGAFVTRWNVNSVQGMDIGPSDNVYALSGTIRRFDGDGTELGYTGTGSDPAADRFNVPNLMAVDSLGHLLVSDQSNNRVQAFTAAGALANSIASFTSPSGIAVRANGYVYVASSTQAGGSYNSGLTLVGGIGAGCVSAAGVAVDPATQDIYVADNGGNRIRRYTALGTFLSEYGTAGAGNGQFNGPYGLAWDSAGNVYVADSNNHRIQKFNSSGTYVAQWGTYGTGAGQFNQPKGIALDPADNHLYVADYGNARVVETTDTGGFVCQWGSLGTGNGQFNRPVGVAVDASGNLYVSEDTNNRVQKFGP